MTDSLHVTKSPLNIESTQQALTMLRNLRQKRKKQNPASIYQLVKTIYIHLKDSGVKKGVITDTISSQDYLGTNRQSIQQMLLYVKSKIIDGGCSFNNPQTQTINKNKNQLEQLQISLNKKQTQIHKLTETIKNSDHQSKTLQIKLLNNVKRLNLQLQEKDSELNQLKKIVNQKQVEMDQLAFLNQKQYKKIRKLEEDLYDLQMELQQKNQELQAEKQCADFLEKKVGKLIDRQSHIIHEKDQHNQTISQAQYQQVYPQKIQHTQSNILLQQKQSTGTQTQASSPFSSQTNSEQNNQCQNEGDNQDQLSQSSILTESKQSKYIESIQRLTLELGQAYNRINQLMKNSDNIQQYNHDEKQKDKRKSIDMITSDHVRLNVDEQNTRGINIVNKHEVNKGKNKSRSGYFSKFWK